MLRSSYKHIMTVCLLFCLVLTSILPVAATSVPTPSSDPASVKAYYDQTQMYENAIREMERYISVTRDGTLTFSKAFPVSSDNSNTIYADLQASLAKTNEMIRSGELKLAEVDITTFDDDEKQFGMPEGECNGKNKIKKYWWGRKIYFDSCKVNAIVGGIVGGLALVALLGGPAAAILVPFLAIEFVWVASLAQLGGSQKGMYFAITWVAIHWWGIQ